MGAQDVTNDRLEELALRLVFAGTLGAFELVAWVWGPGFKVSGLGFKVFRIQGSGFRV